MQLHQGFSFLRRQNGAFLVIALILIIVLAGLGIASMSETVTSARVSRNYSDALAAQETARSMAGYAARILGSYTEARYPAPATCNSAATCNIIVNTFPQSGRPTLVWESGLGTATLIDTSQSNAWWTTNGFAYEEAFGGSTNARVVVSLLGADTSPPYNHTYRIVGYATDPSGVVRATSEQYHQWNGYAPDPGDGTCLGGCHYGECCSNTSVCATDQASCEGASATYVPPGWTCTDYFEVGLGYGSSACAHPVAPP